MVKGWVSCHAFEVMVDFITSSIYCLHAPADEMVFEETFIVTAASKASVLRLVIEL